jgi:hypothetical protein
MGSVKPRQAPAHASLDIQDPLATTSVQTSAVARVSALMEDACALLDSLVSIAQ